MSAAGSSPASNVEKRWINNAFHAVRAVTVSIEEKPMSFRDYIYVSEINWTLSFETPLVEYPSGLPKHFRLRPMMRATTVDSWDSQEKVETTGKRHGFR